MTRSTRALLVAGLLAGLTVPASGFSLMGPLAPWQTPLLSYDINAPWGGFGPMNIGEEYRFNVPVLYYGFSSDFLNYFGQRGAEEVDKAMRILNALPPASEIRLNDFPLSSSRINHRAQALGLIDLKSFVLQQMLYQVGVSDPTRYVYCLRQRYTFPTCPPLAYFVIKRNFDPVTWEHSSYVNGDLWTYNTIIDSCTNPKALLLPEPVDPLALLGLRRAPVTSVQAGLFYGLFWTTLTRDDAAALKYIYRPNNYNVENAPPGIQGGTNVVFLGNPQSPWRPPAWLLTNGLLATNLIGGTNTLIEPALRPGVQKLTFARADYDSMLGGFFTPVTNYYSETVVVNNRSIKQNIQRVATVPDIVFDAGDVQGPDGLAVPPLWVLILPVLTGLAWDNNNDLNGPQPAGGPYNYGPGTIPPGTPAAPGTPTTILTLSSLGPMWGNVWPSFTSEADAYANGWGPNSWFLWGSFDGTTNAPAVYPVGTSIEDIERRVLGP